MFEMTRSVPPFSAAPEAVFAGEEELHAASVAAASAAAASRARPLVRAFIRTSLSCDAVFMLLVYHAGPGVRTGTDLIPIPIRSA